MAVVEREESFHDQAAEEEGDHESCVVPYVIDLIDAHFTQHDQAIVITAKANG